MSNCLFFYLFQYSLNPIGTISAFPHGTRFTIEYIELFKFREWSPYLQTIFYLDCLTLSLKIYTSNRTFTFFGQLFHTVYFYLFLFLNPISLTTTFGISIDFFYFLILRCFTFQKCLKYNICFHIRKFIK